MPLDTWIDVDGLDSSNSEENVFKRGFISENNDQGMLFATGGMRIAPPAQEGVESGLHRFVYGQMFLVGHIQRMIQMKRILYLWVR